jgi:hypothetical protein
MSPAAAPARCPPCPRAQGALSTCSEAPPRTSRSPRPGSATAWTSVRRQEAGWSSGWSRPARPRRALLPVAQLPCSLTQRRCCSAPCRRCRPARLALGQQPAWCSRRAYCQPALRLRSHRRRRLSPSSTWVPSRRKPRPPSRGQALTHRLPRQRHRCQKLAQCSRARLRRMPWLRSLRRRQLSPRLLARLPRSRMGAARRWPRPRSRVGVCWSPRF